MLSASEFVWQSYFSVSIPHKNGILTDIPPQFIPCLTELAKL